MFVRWKSRKSTDGISYHARSNSVTHYAVLVESVRVSGKPQQKFIAHLGNYNEGNRFRSRNQHIDFWKMIHQRLNELKITGDDRKRIEQKLTERVQQPTEEEIQEAQRQEAAFLARIFNRSSA